MRCCRKNRQLALPRLRLHRQEWSSVRLPPVLPPASSLVQSTSVCVCMVFLHTHLLARHLRNPARPVMLAAPASGMVYAFAVSMLCVQRTLSSH